jgi:hypothetical protein
VLAVVEPAYRKIGGGRRVTPLLSSAPCLFSRRAISSLRAQLALLDLPRRNNFIGRPAPSNLTHEMNRHAINRAKRTLKSMMREIWRKGRTPRTAVAAFSLNALTGIASSTLC